MKREFTMLPQHAERHFNIPEYHNALKEARNKGQMLRVALRTLSSMGYHANISPELWAKIQPFIEDFKE